MNVFDALLLGVLQGLAEWLPISSEGLTTLVVKTVYGQSFERALGTSIWLHVGTLLAACLYFRRDLASMVLGLFEEGQGRKLLKFLTLATLASAATALPALTLLRQVVVPDSLFTISIGLLILSVSLLSKTIKAKSNRTEVNYQAAVIVGLVQGLSIIPGISRSGVTIAAFLILGFGLFDSLRLSYLLSIPAIAAAQVALPAFLGFTHVEFELVAGAAAAMVVGLATIGFMLKASLKTEFRAFTAAAGGLIFAAGLLLLYLGG
ncbi:MAG: undecaprenyl-diphosphate phosphatase [Candidatus Caldarchaeum sp.]|nr:undecaprenyl-diphosphate phosphatase [Candidatus Caldarchaeum sp.]